jgi:nucleoside diphosphate kinase
MAVTRTFSIIKPDATRRNLTGAVTAMLEGAGLRVVASKRIHMSREQAEGFYAVHKERPFFGELCDFMMSEPVVVQVLEGEDAVTRNRDIWAQPTLLMRRKAPSARRMRCRSVRIPSMVRTAMRMRRSRLRISSSRKRLLVDPAPLPLGEDRRTCCFSS